ncbi:unnamed protein product [Hydatigera taeniaeformis]|uniref:Ovule protein n=1 Tax=Hydatigena taeniaeformis TaxID=6205 RepID=A0A0R3X3S5_HYDTA|nr:unnamed protein product [Hydatigera taeniaeformis]
MELEDSLLRSYLIYPTLVDCAIQLPIRRVALGLHFPSQLYDFFKQTLMHVRRGEHRHLQAFNGDISSSVLSLLDSDQGNGKQPHLVSVY